MQEKNITLKVLCPSLKDFSAQYPQYASYANKEGKELFNLLTTPTMILKAISASQIGAVAVAGIAEDVVDFWKKSKGVAPSNYTKQFVGAIICTIMLCNNFRKSGKKKSVGHTAFSKGELYLIGDKQ